MNKNFQNQKKSFLSIVALLSIVLIGCKDPEKNNPITYPDKKGISLSLISADKAKGKENISLEKLKVWQRLDIIKDSVPGASVDRAYAEIIKNKNTRTVTVAVIDAGIDINHKDLKPVIWKNKKEIPGDGVDNDKNGYIDDVHGWNFLGKAASFSNTGVRFLKKLHKKYKNLKPEAISKEDKAEYSKYLKLKAENDAQRKVLAQGIDEQSELLASVQASHNLISKALKKETYTKTDLSKITDKNLKPHVEALSPLFAEGNNPIKVINIFKEVIKDSKNKLDTELNLDFEDRRTGDNPNNINDKSYGDNRVEGNSFEESNHGTHVAGIIGSVGNNQTGMKGVAKNIRIMVVRAIPRTGDEYDKDVALAIRYAVDNGASIINMSFSKNQSNNFSWVKEAMKYAEKKDVLIVAGAGNDQKNIDNVNIYPQDQGTNGIEFISNFISVGAITHTFNSDLVADFSNYGKSRVDIFAPGSSVWSTLPNNLYDFKDGTSMATPVVTGIAATIRSLYPNLKANEVKDVIINGGVQVKINVKEPKSKRTRKLSDLCKSGRIANLYNSLILASKK